MKPLLATAAIALTTLGTAGSAASISLVSGDVIPLADDSPIGQDYVAELQAAGMTNMYSGPMQLLSGMAKFTFTLVAAESGFDNSLFLGDTSIIAESTSNSDPVTGADDFLTGSFDGGEGQNSFVYNFMGGDIGELLSFYIGVGPFGGATNTFTSGDDEFAVFANSADIANLDVFFLAFDDSGNNDDDDHDDIIIRVNVEAVPIPASGLLLLGGLGGLAAMRRRKKA